ncbi:MAG: hypothetical protein HOV81_27360 [Kofleriaceae bacterium]|nr:hypothetical protein [Kofleriaceae bacterium]
MVTKDAAVDAKVYMDAPPPQYDFTCMSNPAPADGQAPADITLSGTVQEISVNPVAMTASIDPVAGATLNACKAGAANCAAGNKLAGPATSATDGTWSLGPIATSTNPVDGYMTLTKATYKNVNIFPPQALIASQAMIPALTFKTTTFQLLVGALQIDQQAANGTMAVFVTDCANTPVDGATVTVKQGGNDVQGTTDFDAGAFDAMGAGVHLVFNVPPGDTEVAATLGSQTFRAHVVKVVADEMTETIVRPGYF